MNLQTAEGVGKILVITSTIGKETFAETCSPGRTGPRVLTAASKYETRTQELSGLWAGWLKWGGGKRLVYFGFLLLIA